MKRIFRIALLQGSDYPRRDVAIASLILLGITRIWSGNAGLPVWMAIAVAQYVAFDDLLSFPCECRHVLSVDPVGWPIWWFLGLHGLLLYAVTVGIQSCLVGGIVYPLLSALLVGAAGGKTALRLLLVMGKERKRGT